MRHSSIVAVAAALLLAACNTAAPKPPSPGPGASSGDTAASAARPGTGSIRGRGFVTLPSGDMVTCAGQKILAVWSSDGEVKNGQREATCNAQGYFEFTGVPAGTWRLKTMALWRIRDTDMAQGTLLWKDNVLVQAGQETKEVVARILCCSRDASNVGWVEFFTVDMKTGKVSGRIW